MLWGIQKNCWFNFLRLGLKRPYCSSFINLHRMQTALRPNSQRAKIAIAMIGVVLGFQIVSCISDFMQLTLLNSVQNGYSYAMDTLNANDLRQRVIAILNFCVLIASAVTFIQWFRRAYYNLHLMDGNLRFTEGWASGGWFVPILSLFRPYQIMSEMFYVARAILVRNLPHFQPKQHSNMLGVWWALWVINNIWGNVSSRMSISARTLDALVTSTHISMWNIVIQIPLALIAIRVVQEYSGMEGLLATPAEIFKEDSPVVIAPEQPATAPSINLEKGPSAE